MAIYATAFCPHAVSRLVFGIFTSSFMMRDGLKFISILLLGTDAIPVYAEQLRQLTNIYFVQNLGCKPMLTSQQENRNKFEARPIQTRFDENIPPDFYLSKSI
jgi:hypothetical protein